MQQLEMTLGGGRGRRRRSGAPAVVHGPRARVTGQVRGRSSTVQARGRARDNVQRGYETGVAATTRQARQRRLERVAG